RYRGRLNIIRNLTGPGLTVINRVPLESYVAGVMGPEMGPRRQDETQALLSQAVVSRTFALRNRGRWESDGLDAWSDTRDQVYPGVAGETATNWQAVRATAGQVLMYHGQLIEAYFHSTCGYRAAGALFATGVGCQRRRSLLRRHIAPFSLARGMGRPHAADDPGTDPHGRGCHGRERRRAAADHRRGRHADDPLGPGGRAADRV